MSRARSRIAAIRSRRAKVRALVTCCQWVAVLTTFACGLVLVSALAAAYGHYLATFVYV